MECFEFVAVNSTGVASGLNSVLRLSSAAPKIGAGFNRDSLEFTGSRALMRYLRVTRNSCGCGLRNVINGGGIRGLNVLQPCVDCEIGELLRRKTLAHASMPTVNWFTWRCSRRLVMRRSA
ncbi:unnamed protein product [Toxocara canis]|uniref:Uncharacterized protein n=1 Tax=Toxocara canis TaxID=6265 RepID=A0A183UXR5_TOXCA|nr:unnamed protein product [Toxocara canis]